VYYFTNIDLPIIIRVVGIIVIKRRPEHDQQQYVFPSKKKHYAIKESSQLEDTNFVDVFDAKQILQPIR